MNLNLNRPIAFFDIEATGLSIVNDRIVEISVLKIDLDGTETSYTKRVNPKIPISEEASGIHGVYDKDVVDLPGFDSIGQELFDFMAGCDLGGYNLLRFDVPMLLEEFLRIDLDFDVSKINIVDAQVVFHLMEARTLTAAYQFYCDKDLTNAHNAEADTRATYEVLMSQIERYNGMERKDRKGNPFVPVENDMKALAALAPNKNVDPQGRMIWKNGVEVFNFGKYKNQSVRDVLGKDKGYFDWMIKGEFALSTKNELKKIKMEMLKDSF